MPTGPDAPRVMSRMPAGVALARNHNRTVSWTVSDVMTRDVVFVEPDTAFKVCADLMRIHAVSGLPVLDLAGRVLGVVSESDLLAKEEARGLGHASIEAMSRRHRRAATARVAEDVMTSPAIAVGPSTTVAEAARLMHRKGVKRLPVVDHDGGLVGIVSRADLMKCFIRSDEAIRRDIVKEVLHHKPPIDLGSLEVSVRGGVVRLRGQVETASLASCIEREANAVEGAVGVDSSLTYRL